MVRPALANGSRGRRGASGTARPAAEGLWDRPQLLNLAADLLMLLSAAVLAYAALVSALRLPFFPLKQLAVFSTLDHVTPAQLESAARSSLAGNFFTVNLDRVRGELEKLPWVRSASLRRHWPDGIELTIEEQVAAARWRSSEGETRLVNSHGEVFAAAWAEGPAALPLFGGPEGSAASMLARYREFAGLLAPLGRSSRTMTLTARQAWQLRLDNELTLQLGRDQAEHPLQERLQRFVATYPEIRARANAPITAIDMRYPNGFALRLAHGGAAARQDDPNPARSRKGDT